MALGCGACVGVGDGVGVGRQGPCGMGPWGVGVTLCLYASQIGQPGQPGGSGVLADLAPKENKIGGR